MGACNAKAQKKTTAILQSAKLQVRQKKADKCFERHDRDKSGYIERKELSTIMKDVLNVWLTEHQVEALLQSTDTNHDGKIDKKEFRTMYFRLLDPSDPCNQPFLQPAIRIDDLEVEIFTPRSEGEAALVASSLQIQAAMGSDLVQEEGALLARLQGLEGEDSNNLEVIDIKLSLTHMYIQKKHLAKAKAMLQEVTDANDSQFPSHLVWLATAELLFAEGEDREALAAYEACVKLTQVQGCKIPTANIAYTHRKFGDFRLAQAKNLHSKQEQERKEAKKAGENKTLLQRAKTKYGIASKENEVRKLSRPTVDAVSNKRTNDTYSKAELLNMAGDCYYKAVSVVEKKEADTITPEEHGHLALSYKGLALVYQTRMSLLQESSKNAKFAEIEYKKCLAIQKKLFLACSFQLSSTYSNLGGLYVYMNFKQPMVKEAVEAYDQAMPFWLDLEKRTAVTSKGLTLIYRNLHSLYNHAGDEAKAQEYQALYRARRQKRPVTQNEPYAKLND